MPRSASDQVAFLLVLLVFTNLIALRAYTKLWRLHKHHMRSWDFEKAERQALWRLERLKTRQERIAKSVERNLWKLAGRHPDSSFRVVQAATNSEGSLEILVLRDREALVLVEVNLFWLSPRKVAVDFYTDEGVESDGCDLTRKDLWRISRRIESAFSCQSADEDPTAQVSA